MCRRRSFAVLCAGIAIGSLAGLMILASSVAQEKEAPPAPTKPQIRPATEKEKKDASAAIEAQLKAFKADDYEKASKFQHSELRKNFPSPADFRRAIRTTYPQFAAYRSVSFGEARATTDGSHLEIKIVLTGQDGVTVRATYMMVREEGEYRVAGVQGGIPAKGDKKNIA